MPTGTARGPSRREFIALGLGAFVVAAVPLGARTRRERVVRRTLPVMGTLAEVAVVHGDAGYAHRAIDAALDELRRVERTMTRFSPTSDIGRANRGAGGAVVVSAATAAVVTEALAWADATDGAYDPALGAAVALWDVAHRAAPPPGERIAHLAGRRLYRAVEVGSAGDRPVVRLHDADAQLDLGAIAKGYGVDRAAAILREWGIGAALVNVGGDLVAIGRAPDGEPWRVGIQDPADDRALLRTVELEDAALATSGTYRQFFRWRGRRYHHLLDPATGQPRATPVQTLTVQASDCMRADVAATALFGMTAARAAAVLARRAPGARVLHSA